MTKQKKSKLAASSKSILNRRARYDYELIDELRVGIVLSGPEVRAARDHHVQLKGSYVTVKSGELWLNNASFSVKTNEPNSSQSRTVQTQPRKLLAKQREISNLLESKKTGMTIVPLKLITTGKFIKLIISLGKGKKSYDKRQTIKKRDLEREARQGKV
jgi:SsrA-binding protein